MRTLIDKLMRTCTVRARATEPDGEGGTVTTWADAGTFPGVISREASAKVRRGERDVTTTTANLTTPPDVSLPLHAVLRDWRGRTWRVTNEPHRFPSVATHDYNRYTVEAWEETT